MKRLLVVLLVALALGCATGNVTGPPSTGGAVVTVPKATIYKSLQTAGVTYDTTMKIIADLYVRKIISDDVKAKAIAYGTTFKNAYNVAISVAEAGGTPDIGTVTQALNDLVSFVKLYIPAGGK